MAHKGLQSLTLLVFVVFPQAYSVYDEEIGYCQGQSFLAAVLLLHVSKQGSVMT